MSQDEVDKVDITALRSVPIERKIAISASSTPDFDIEPVQVESDYLFDSTMITADYSFFLLALRACLVKEDCWADDPDMCSKWRSESECRASANRDGDFFASQYVFATFHCGDMLENRDRTSTSCSTGRWSRFP